jgi:two-component system chemotaxis response regulator CheB
VVFGMPKEAIARGGVDRIAPLDNIAREIMAAQARF